MGERERERRRRRRREEEALAERKRIHIMSLAKHTWVWNKKFTVKTTTKLLLATSPCKSKSISSNNEILERQEADRLFENRSGLLRRRRRRGGKLAVFARASAAAGRNSVNVSSSIEDPAVEKKKEGERERREEEERRNVVGNIQTVAKKYSSSSSSSSSVSEELPLSKSAIPVETVKALKADLFGQQVGNPIVDDVGKLSSQTDVLRRLVEMSKTVERDGLSLKEEELSDEKRVPGCAARVWIDVKAVEVAAEEEEEGREGREGGRKGGGGEKFQRKLQFRGHSDSSITKGLCTLLCRRFSGFTPEEFVSFDESFLKDIGISSALGGSHHRYGLFSIFESMKKQVYNLMGKREHFPSLVITKDDLIPKGSYAESQATYLKPKAEVVDSLVALLKRNKVGVVAHFYMDPEVQGVLSSAQGDWPHVYISDSLVMADRAVEMAKQGCDKICVLGVDFMSENVRATLDHQGYTGVQVFRMDTDLIGCTLAEAAESEGYDKYLEQAARQENSLHVVYINTSLKTKAIAHSQVPTITCTSSNVVQTILQSTSQMNGDVDVFYGPDSYMGANIQEMLLQLSKTSDEEVKKIHPDHDIESIRRLLERFHYFRSGICLVHDMFGSEVARSIKENYADAFLTAHFEVPGEMFRLALHASHNGDRGVIGSTKNILDFIVGKVEEATSHGLGDKLQFVLGTESGMITSVVNAVQSCLQATESEVSVEIVFPVGKEAIVSDGQVQPPEMPFGLNIIPGAASGEGCGIDGGCASCPYMKMNSLDALMTILTTVDQNSSNPLLEEFAPRKYEESIAGQSFAQVGTVPILHMRHFQQNKSISEELLDDIRTRKKYWYQ